ncbi:MAG: YdeI/OmpD-associated family protein [Oscillospiraceae bacterium]|nr:YdeI/OmpD-associated family protein [Oscillospiraceae bacterium]
MEITNILHITTRSELRAWLALNCATVSHAWVPVISKEPGELSYLAVVEEAICFGWIDSTKKRHGDVMYQRISPRRKSGNWTELNKERARRLIKLGLMTPQGAAALPNMSESSFMIAPYVMDAIMADKETYANFKKLPPLYVRIRVDNIQSYPQGDETYERRLSKFLESTKNNILYGDWNDSGRL